MRTLVLFALAFALNGCSKGAKSVDAFFGPQSGDVVNDPAYQLTFDPTTYDFGEVLITETSPHSKTINVFNNTGVTLYIASVVGASADSVWTITNETCSLLQTGLLANGTCHFTLNFKPSASGRLSYNVNFKFGLKVGDETKNSLFTAFGRGMTPANILLASDPLYDFGPVVRTASLTKQILVSNTGDWPATLVTGYGTTTPFSFAGGAFPGTGGSCAATLAGNSTCTIGVNFTPPSTGLYSSEVDLSYFDGNQNQVSHRAIQGTGALPASLAISDAPSYDFGSFAIGATVEKSFTITNSGGVSATQVNGSGLAAPFLFKGGAYPGTGGTCGASIDAGASCQVVVTFSPTTTGTATANLGINYNDGLTVQLAERQVAGTGVTPAALTLSSAPFLDFGTQIVGSTTQQSLTLTNSGGYNASFVTPNSLSAPFAYKGGTFPGTGGNCGANLAPSASCTIVVTYAPIVAGSLTGNVQISYNNGASTQSTTRALQGNAVTAASLLISLAPSYDFGTKPVGSSTDQTFTVSNSGGTAATAILGAGLVSPFSFKGGSYPGTGGTCGTSIAAGATCSIVATYAPSATGTSTSDIQISYFDGLNAQTALRTLNGNAVTPANLAISDAPSYDFQTQPIGLVVSKTFTLTNSGGYAANAVVAASLASPFSFKGGGFPGTGGTCASTVSANSSCTFVVTYQAAAAVTSSATVSVSYSDGTSTQTATRALSGTGVTPANITISDSPVYDFGPVATGAFAEKTLTLTNAGQFVASSVAAAAFTGPFAFKGGTFPGTGGTCGTSLAPSASCSVVLKFAPTALGTFADSLTITYSNGVTNVNSVRAIQGVGTTPALLTLSDAPSFNFGTFPAGATTSKTFSIANSGGVAAQSINGLSLSAPFAYLGGSFPGTGGSCGSSLSASSSCTIIVTFSPAATGLFTGQLKVSYNDTVSAQTATRDIAGTGVTPAQLTITPSPTALFGTVAVGGAADVILTVTNGGQYASSTMAGGALANPFSYKGGAYPGTGGTCATTLAAGASCTILATYSPTATGTQTATLSMTYFDGSAAQSTSRALSGQGAAPASLVISDASTYDFGTIANGGSSDHTFAITNQGGVPATSMAGGGLANPFKFKGGAFPGTGGTCAATLAVSDSCTVVVTFAPTSNGVSNSNLNIGFFDGASAQTATRPVTGTAVAPALLTFSDSPLYDYGTLAVGASSDHVFTLTNSGAVNATTIAGSALAGNFAFKGGSFPGTGGTCGATLIPGASCSVIVTFTPAYVGSFSQSVNATYFNGVTSQTASRSIQGAGAQAGQMQISDGATYDFGSAPVGSTREKTFTVSNIGGVPTTAIAGGALAAPFTFKGGSYPGTGATCATTLAPSASCTIVVQFMPTALGAANSVVNLTYNDGLQSQTSSRAVQGTGVPPATLVVSDGPTYDFGTIPTGAVASKTFTISNTGGVPATSVAAAALAAPYGYKGGGYPGTGGTCASTLAVSATCTIVVTYSPTSTGAQSSSVDINYNDGVNAQTTSRAVMGTGVAPALVTVSDSPSYTYPALAVGSSSDKTFTLSNSGGVAATSLTGSGLAAPFAFKGGSFPGAGGTCGTSLAASATCTVVVTYAPTTVATSNATLSIGYNDGVATQSSTRTLAGTAVADALIAISDAPTYDFGTVAIGAVQEKTLTLTNSGGFSASSLNGTGLAAPFAFKGGSYPGLGGTCGASLAASGTCTIVVTFTPTAIGAVTQSIAMAYFDGAASQTAARGVQGTGATPASLAFSDGPVFNFGTKATGSATDKALTLTNSGGVSATSVTMTGLSAPFTFKGGSYPGTGGTCAASLAPSASCTVVVTYAPTATGSQTVTLAANFSNGISVVSATRDLSGVGAAPAVLAISNGPTYDYGTVATGAVISKSFTVTNSGGVDATSLSGSGLAAPFAFKGGGYPGTGGTCATTLAASATCTIIIDFAPTAAGVQNATVSLAYQDGVQAQSATRALAGTAVAPALLTLSDGPTYDYGALAVSGSVDKIITVANSGSLAASSMNGAALAPPFAFKGGTYPGTGGTCASSLAPSATCTIVVTFHPTAVGSYTAAAEVDYNDGAQAQAALRALQGVGAPPAVIAISDGATYDFGNVPQGASLDKTFTLQNNGGVTASTIAGVSLSAPYSFKGGTFPGTGGTCAASLAATATCTVVVTFSPTALGAQAASLAINFYDGLQTQTSTRPMTGTGVAPALMTVSDGPTYDFGTIATGASVFKTLTITNTGNFTATSVAGPSLAAPFSYKGGAYPGVGGSCGTTLNIGASCSIVISYSPTATGTQSANVTLNYFDGAQSQSASRAIQGTGAAPSLLSISDGATYNYGTLAAGGSADKSFIVTNSGGVSATALAGGGLATPYSFKGGTYPGTGGTCGATLAPATTCSVVVTYAPTTTGVTTSEIDLSYNDGVTTQLSVRALSGTAVTPASLSLSDGPTYDFALVAIGAANDKTLTLTNSGGFQATTLAGAGLSGAFSFKGGAYPGTGGTCSSSLNAGASCTVVVTFAPTASGLVTSNTQVTYYNGAVSQTASRAVQGTGAVAAQLTFAEAPSYDFGTRATGSSMDHTFSISNTGGVSATSVTSVALSSGFTFKGGTYPGTGGTCSTSLAASATCTLVVTFAPTASGSASNTLQLNYSNGVGSVSSSIAMSGIGAAPALIAISDGLTYDYGSVATGGTAEKTFTLTNSGGINASSLAGSGLAAPFAFKGSGYPGTGGTCTTTLNAGASCTIVVTFAPVTVASFNGSINIAYNDGVTTQNVSRAVQGVGAAPALLTISDGATYDFGAVVVSASANKTFTITNTGSLTATSVSAAALTAPFSYKGGSFPGSGGNCGASLNPGSSCTIILTFAPTVLGSATDTLTLTYNNGASSQTASRPLQGTGATAASITVSDGATYDFGSVANGATVEKAFTLTNGGGVFATSLTASALSAPFSFKGGAYPGTGGTCAATLAPAATCSVVVVYSPTAIGTQNATLTFNYNNGVTITSATRAVTGTAVTPAVLAVSDGPTYDYGTRATGSAADKTFTITNGGAYTASSMAGVGLSAPFTFKGGTYPGTGGSCSTTLASSATCTIVVTYAPTATGTQSATLSLNYFDGAASNSATRAVQGTGAAPAVLAVSDGPTYNFGSLAYGNTADKIITVTNSGGIPAAGVNGSGLSAPYSFKGGTFPGTGGTCGSAIAAASSCTVVVTFAPTVAGSTSSTMTLAYNDGVTSQSVSLGVAGTASAPALLTLSDGPTYSFGNVANGSTNEKSFTVTNTGGFLATSLSGTGLTAPFTFKGGAYPGSGGTCSTTLAASATCTIVVSYAPTVSSTSNATLSLSYNDGVGATSVSRSMTGISTAPAVLSLSDGPTYDYGTRATGSTLDHTFTLSNTGAYTASSLLATGVNAPYSFKGGTFPGTGGTCASTLAASSSCVVVITYAPTATGVQSITLSFAYNDGANAQTTTRTITGTGVAPATITISDGPSFDFGTRATGSSTDKTFTLQNTGGITASSLSGGGLAAPFTFKGGTYPGAGGTCSSSLSPAGSCTVVVTYAPTANGASSGSLNISFDDGVTTQSSSRTVNGTAVAPALLTVSDGPTFDFGSVATTGSADKVFTLQNTGGLAAATVNGGGLGAPYTYKGGTFPGTGGTCGATLAAGASCTFVVTFAPTANGSTSSNVAITYFDGALSQTAQRAIQGAGAPPASLLVSDGPTYDFGTIARGGVATKTLTITNGGGVNATSVAGASLSAPFSYLGGIFPGTGGTCAAQLNLSTSCTVVVVYSPTATNSDSATLTVNYFNGLTNVSATRPMTGTAVAPANLTINNGPTYDFGSLAIGASAEATFTVTNTGNFPSSAMAGAGLAAPFTFKDGSYPGTGGTCAATLGVGASCTIVVKWTPTATGSQSGSLQVTYNDGAQPQTATRALSGTGVAPALITISNGPQYDFGAVANGSSNDKTLTLTNTGGITASAVNGSGLAAPFTFKGGTFPGTGGTCSSTLGAGAACTVIVTFAPTVTASATSTMTIAYNNGVSAQTSTRDLLGSSSDPAVLAISDGPVYNYGNVANGSVNDKAFTVSNTGAFTATSMNGSGLSAPYAFKNGTYPGAGGTCSSTLAAGANCTVVLTYAPTTSGTANATAAIGYNDGVTTKSATRSLTGISTNPALLALSDGPVYDYGTIAIGASADKTFTLSNTGAFTASSMVLSGIGAPFSYKGGSYPGTGGTCGTSLAASSTCTIVISYVPTATGLQSTTLNFGYYDGASAQTAGRQVQGTGVAPANITVSDGPTYNFGTRATGSTTDKSIVLTNGGGLTATSMSGGGLAAPFTFKGGSYPGTGGTCGSSLASGNTCTVIISYAPTVNATDSGSLDITYNNGVVSQTSSRPVAGVAVAPAVLTISDGATFDFGAVATTGSADKVFTMTNTGAFTASSVTGGGVSAPYTYKGGTFPGTGGTCGATLAPSASCTFVVTFAPTANGTTSSQISVSYNDGANSQTTVRALQGTGAPPAQLLISDGPTYDFGTIANGGTANKALTITNTGGVNATSVAGLTLAAPFSFRGGTFPGTGGTCTTSLNVSSTCTIVVSYSPTAIGSLTKTLSVSYNNGLISATSTRDLTGTAVAPANLTINNGPTYDFGSLATGSSLDATFTVTNSGNFTASAMTGLGLGAPFTYKGGSYPGTGGTCSTSLAVSSSCTIVVTWAPTATGSQSSSLLVGYNDGAQAQSATRSLMGTGVAPALITISNSPTYDYGAVANGSVNDKQITLTNSGGIAATGVNGSGLIAPFSFKGGTFPGTGGSCTATLAAGASCTMTVTYAPTVTNSYSSTLTISYNNGVSAQTATNGFTGTSSAPASLLISDAATFSFGNKANGSTTDKVFTVTNNGAFTSSAQSPTALAAPYSFKGGIYPGSGGTCGLTLAGSASCTIVVTYAPTSTGTANATLTLSYNDGVTTQTANRPMTGVSTPPANLTATPATTYDFGTLATSTSADVTYTLNNSGGYDATTLAGSGLAAPFTFKGGTFPGTGGTCTPTLAASSSCTVVVTFAPTATGTTNQVINFTYFDGAQAKALNRSVIGTGAAPATIAVSDGPTYDYGTLAAGASADKTLTLTNGGGFSATALAGGGLSTPFGFKGGSYPGTGGTCSTTLAPSATCTIVVTFAPTVNGSYSSTATLTYNNGVTTTSASRALQGAAADPASLSISDGATYDFGPVANTGSKDKTFIIANSGGVIASSLGGSGLSAPFTFKGGSFPGTGGTCGSTLNPGLNCTVVVTFAPLSSGTTSSSMTISYNNGISGQTATRAVQGTGAPPAVITVSDAATYNYGTVANNSANDHTFTINNTGGVAATSLSANALSAPFSFKGGTFPGTGGTCTNLLATGASCTVVVTYSPTTVATHNGTLTMTYQDGLQAQTSPRPLVGTAVTPAILGIDRGPTYDYGTVATGATVTQTFTVINSGNFVASGLSVTSLSTPFSFKGGGYPGTGGTCGTSLAISASCTLVVQFAPTATGTVSQSINLNYNDGAQAQVASRPVQGFGAAPALLTLSDGPSFSFGTVANGAVVTKTFTVSNSGGVSATSLAGGGIATPFTFVGGTYPGTGGTCSSTLAASAACTIVVQFAPTTTNTYSTAVTVAYNDGVTSQTAQRALTATSAPAAVVTISDGATYNYGTVAAGASANKTFTLTNSGGVTATSFNAVALSVPYGYAGGSYPGTGGTCSATLAASATCTIVVTFAPTASGSYTNTITIGYSDGVTTVNATRDIQGVGAAPANLTISDGATYNYGTVAKGSITDKTFSVTNTGGAQATAMAANALLAPYSFKGGSYPGAGGTCGATLLGSATCTIVVTYSPTSVSAADNATISIGYNSGISTPTATRNITGTSVAPALITFDIQTTYSFGKLAVGATTDATLQMTNNGSFAATSLTDAMTLSAPFTYKGGVYPGTGGTCGTSLGVGVSCTVVLRFAPTSTGTPTQSARINYYDGANSTNVARAVTGTGATAAILTVSDAGFDYGTVAVGASASKTFTVTNSGGVPATSISPSAISSDFNYLGGTYPGTGGTCSSSLADTSGNTCTIVVTFAPTSVGAKAGTITLNYTDGLTAQTANRAITGTGASPASLAYTLVTDPFDYGSIETGLTSDQSFTIQNNGGVTATSINMTGAVAPFTLKGGAFPGTGGTCGTSLAASATCTIVVTFAPTAVGSASLTTTLSYNTAVGTSSITKGLKGTGIAPTAPSSLTRSSPASSPFTSSTVSITVGGVRAGELVKLYRDSACTGAMYNSGTVAVSQTTIALSDTVSTDGTYNWYATRTNANGTLSACSTATASYTRDTTPPTLTSAINFSPGTSPGYNANPVIRVAGTFANDTVKIWSNSSCTTLVTSTSGITGSSVDMTIPTIGSVSHNTYYVTANDVLNNTTSCSLLSPIVYDFDNVYQTISISSPSSGGYFQTVNEGDTVNATLTMTGAKTYDVTVNYRASGTALANGSNLPNTGIGTVTIPAGSTTANLTFTASTNAGNQGNRFIDIALYDTAYAYAAIGGQVYHRVSINDNSTSVAAPLQLPMGYSAGYLVACYIDNNKKLWCIGRGTNGAVGDGTNVDRENYVQVLGSENFAKVVNGLEHTCAMTAAGGVSYPNAGTVLCWGLNSSYQVDNTGSNKNQPVLVSGFTSGARDVAAGGNTSCAINSAGILYCWGSNNYGQAKMTASGGNVQTPNTIDSGNTYSAVSVGVNHVCAIRSLNNHIVCWGRNSEGQVGNGANFTSPQVGSVTDVDALIAYQSVTVGEYFSCGLIAASDLTNPNRVRCWGYANYGQLGRGNTTTSYTPTTVDTGVQYSSISAGKEQLCGVTTSGSTPANALRCTGRGDLGMSLDRAGVSGNNTVLTTMQSGIAFSKVSAGYLGSWALTTGATTIYGGYNNNFAFNGAGTPVLSKYTATSFDSLNTFASLDQGSGNERTTCSLSSTGKIRCVGGIADAQGMFGIGSAPDMTGYVWVDAANTYTQVASGRYAMCAIRAGGKLWCAGAGTYNGTNANTMTLVNVDSATNYSQIAMGNSSSCAITTTGVLKCWGVNSSGQVGDGTTTNKTTPTIIDSGTTYSYVAVGSNFACGIVSATGRLKCWGNWGNNRLNDNGTLSANQLTPYSPPADTNVYSTISLGDNFGCGISSNKLYCWGANNVYQLGDGATTQRASATPIDSGNSYISVGTGSTNTCAVRTNGALYCWGDWFYGIAGQLGSYGTTPQVMDSGFTYTSVVLGRYRGCGLTNANLIRCFGDGRYNSWGDYTRTWVPEALPAPGFTQH